jgi:tetratricopeptide (TPR) repeat protein
VASAEPLAEALLAVVRRDPARAEAEARRAAEAAPQDPRGRAALALALLAGRRTRAAAAEAAAAVSLAPAAEWALRLAALASREAGRGQDAVAAAEAAVRAAPASGRARRTLVRSLLAAGRTGEAWQAAEEALRSAPDDPAILRLAAALAMGRDPALAERRLRQSLRADPRSAEGRALLARALARQGREEEARSASDAAALLDPALAREDEARRRLVIGVLEAAVVAFLLALAIGFLPNLVASRWAGARGWAMTLAFVATGAAPLVLLGIVAWRMRRIRAAAPLDPEVEELARELLEAAPGLAAPGSAP